MRSVVLIAFLCILSLAAFAQGDRGTITGTVSDPAGAVVANAEVQARNVATGAVFPTVTTATGNYTLAQLPTGPYEITVSVPGFKKYVRQNLTVQVAQTVGIDIALEVGSASEAVTVTAETSLLKTETGDVSHNITSETLNQLPILGIGSAASGSAGIRNPNNVLNVVPGVYYVPNSQVKINGAPSNSQAYHVEGMDSTTTGFPYAAAQTQPSVDAIQEISVQTSNFAPEFGAVAGGFFNVTMRSGGNQYHGSVYDYYVNEVLNAGTPFTDAGLSDSNRTGQLVRTRARRNDYGFTVGGPVSIPKLYNGHDRTFFFFNFEQFRETQLINNIPVTVPTAAYRLGDFSQAIVAAGNRQLTTDVLGRPLFANQIFNPATSRTVNGVVVEDPFTNNTIPQSMMDPVALKVQGFIPNPTSANLINNYLPTYPSTRHTTIPALKLDQNIGSKGKLSFYWSKTGTEVQYSPTYGGSEGLPDQITAARGSFIHSHVERLNYDHTLTPTLLLHVGIGYQTNNFFDDAPILDFDAAAVLGLKGATVKRNVPVFTGLCPVVPLGVPQCSTSPAGGMFPMGPSAGQSHDFWEKPSANASATYVHGSHTFKLGSELFLSSIPAIPYTNTNGSFTFGVNQTAMPYLVGTTFSGGTLGFGYASFLLGAADQFSIAAPAEFHFGKKQFALFLQDSWKVTRKLTLDYGVRWDYGTYYTETYGRSMNFSPTTPNPSAGGALGAWIFEGSGPGHCNCNFAQNYPYAIGPRIGVAYQITPKTVLRAGWGLIYNQTGTNNAGVNTSGIATTNTVGSAGQGAAAMYLANGIPASATPTWPNYNPGIAPLQPIGNQPPPTLGVGGFSNPGMLDPGAGRPARQNQWSVGIQRELTRDLAVEVSYVANRGVWWNAPGLVDLNALTPQQLLAKGIDITTATGQTLLLSQLSSATAAAAGFNKAPYPGFALSNTVAQSLRPFPQFAAIPVFGPPLGKTWYDSLQTKATKRYSKGLVFSGVFTWQKSLQEGVDTNPTVMNNVVANYGNTKSYSSFDQPFVFIASVSYTVPKWQTNKFVSYALRDWQIGTLLQYASGLPIPTPGASTSIGSQLFQGSPTNATNPTTGTLANRVPGVPLYSTNWVDFSGTVHNTPLDLNCHCYDPAKTFVLNPAAWANPAQGQFGNSAEYYGDFRYQRHPQESIGLGRTFKIKERMGLMVRVDFSNIFNRTYLNNPTATGFLNAQTRNTITTSPQFGTNTGGFGYVNLASTSVQFGQPRQGTIVARFTF